MQILSLKICLLHVFCLFLNHILPFHTISIHILPSVRGAVGARLTLSWGQNANHGRPWDFMRPTSRFLHSRGPAYYVHFAMDAVRQEVSSSFSCSIHWLNETDLQTKTDSCICTTVMGRDSSLAQPISPATETSYSRSKLRPYSAQSELLLLPEGSDEHVNMVKHAKRTVQHLAASLVQPCATSLVLYFQELDLGFKVQVYSLSLTKLGSNNWFLQA